MTIYKAVGAPLCHRVTVWRVVLWLAAPRLERTKEVPISSRGYDSGVDVVEQDV
jgi:hypothetical protein